MTQEGAEVSAILAAEIVVIGHQRSLGAGNVLLGRGIGELLGSVSVCTRDSDNSSRAGVPSSV